MKLAYDCRLGRPGCVLIQAALGGTVPRELFSRTFSAQTWLVSMTPDMKIYETTDQQLEQLGRRSREVVP